MCDLLSLPITEHSQIAEARRLSVALARGLGFDETATGRVALVVTEAATNLVKHATRGSELLVRALEWARVGGIEILALDKGPGIANVAEALRDGYSTSGSPGTGLGAIRRLAAFSDIYSVPGIGTALLARLWAISPPSPLLSGEGKGVRLEIGVVSLPKAGEEICGDAWAVEHTAGRSVILVADGLGHGADAARAAREAVKVFRAHPHLSPAEMLEAMHAALRATRGAAVAIAAVDTLREVVHFAGVGNIAGVICAADEYRHLVSHNGTVGLEVRKVQEFTYPWRGDEPSLLILHSDGLATHWDLARYPGLAQRHPSLIAGVLYRDFTRGRDDVTVVVARPVPRPLGSPRP